MIQYLDQYGKSVYMDIDDHKSGGVQITIVIEERSMGVNVIDEINVAFDDHGYYEYR